MKLEYNKIIGRIVKPDDTPATQAELLEWAAANPMEVKVGEPKLTKAKAPVKMMEEGVESITIKEKI